jgi:hypothetical protein
VEYELTMKRSRRGLGLVEGIVGFSIAMIVVAGAVSLFRFGVISVGATVTPQAGLQMASRKALVDFIRQIQECSELVRPSPGASLNYFMARDKLNHILVAYQVQNPADSAAAKKPLYDLYLYRYTYGATPPVQSQSKLLSAIERLTFTNLSPGLIQLNLDLNEQGKNYTLLTAIRLRNVLTEGKL